MASSRRDKRHGNAQVTHILHTLRGEAFRRQLNQQGARIRAPPPLSQGPSLPPALFTSETGDEIPIQHHPELSPKPAGPRPPRSWVPSTHPPLKPTSPEWRYNALSFLFHHTRSPSKALTCPPACNNVPTLFQMCLGMILMEGGSLPPEALPLLPRHILREYVRYSAVYSPLPKEELELMWNLDNAGSIDGEIIITGAYAHALLSRLSSTDSFGVPSDWDTGDESDVIDPTPPLHTFAVVASSFSAASLTLLPATLTHLTLIHIPKLPLHPLPPQVPLLVFLDLSYNLWLAETVSKNFRMEWRKWRDLKVLGMRGCGISEADSRALRGSVNKGRLTDVEIVFLA